MWVKKQQLELDMTQLTGSELLYIVTCLFNFHAEYIMWNARLDDWQAEVKTAGRNINNLAYHLIRRLYHSNGRKLRGTKEPLSEGEEESEKAGMKLNIQKTLESPLDCKEIKPVNPEYSLEGLMLKLKTPVLWPPDVKSRLIQKDPDAGKDWRQEEKGMAEDEMIGSHHRLSGLEFEQIPRDSGGQRSLVSCSLWGDKEVDTT